jgi:hypothetical protein
MSKVTGADRLTTIGFEVRVAHTIRDLFDAVVNARVDGKKDWSLERARRSATWEIDMDMKNNSDAVDLAASLVVEQKKYSEDAKKRNMTADQQRDRRHSIGRQLGDVLEALIGSRGIAKYGPDAFDSTESDDDKEAREGMDAELIMILSRNRLVRKRVKKIEKARVKIGSTATVAPQVTEVEPKRGEAEVNTEVNTEVNKVDLERERILRHRRVTVLALAASAYLTDQGAEIVFGQNSTQNREEKRKKIIDKLRLELLSETDGDFKTKVWSVANFGENAEDIKRQLDRMVAVMSK